MSVGKYSIYSIFWDGQEVFELNKKLSSLSEDCFQQLRSDYLRNITKNTGNNNGRFSVASSALTLLKVVNWELPITLLHRLYILCGTLNYSVRKKIKILKGDLIIARNMSVIIAITILLSVYVHLFLTKLIQSKSRKFSHF